MSALHRQYFSERKTIANVKKLKRKPEEVGMTLLGACHHLASGPTKKYMVHTGFTFKQQLLFPLRQTRKAKSSDTDKSRRGARSIHYNKVWMRPPTVITMTPPVTKAIFCISVRFSRNQRGTSRDRLKLLLGW